jgi:hypothetical protein
MDWELYERQRATLVFIGVAITSLLLLAFQRSAPVQHLKAFFVSCTFPTQRLLARWSTAETPAVPAPAVVPTPALSTDTDVSAPATTTAESIRVTRLLQDENRRLNDLLELKHRRFPRMLAAHVVNRDPSRWFQEVLLDKGREDGLQVDDPVIALAGPREAVVGRVVEVGSHSSRVMLAEDSLSAIAATVQGSDKDDGVAEGTNSHDIWLRYLPRDSQIKIGDPVVTSGLGGIFPSGIPIGWVQDIQLDKRQLFVEAQLRPARLGHPLREVGVLVRPETR